MPLGRAQKPGEPFDPLARTTIPPSASALGRYNRGRRQARLAQARKMREHLQLDAHGRVPGHERHARLSPQERDDQDAKFRDYPDIPARELGLLESIIRRYGLPLEELHSDTAAFILRRVLADYRLMSLLQRDERPPLFTPEELTELMRVMNVNQHQLAIMLTPSANVTPQKRYSVYVQIQRWLQGVNTPQGIIGQRVLRLIRLHVHRKFPTPTNVRMPDEMLSQDPVTVARRAEKRRRASPGNRITPPLASEARSDAE